MKSRNGLVGKYRQIPRKLVSKMFGNVTIHTFKLILACSFGSITYGYVSGVAGTITAQPSFIDYFDYEGDDGKRANAFNGLLNGGGLVGVLFAGYLSELLGRKKSIFVSCCFGVVGGGLMAGAVNLAMLYVARFIMGISFGMIVMLVPLWQTEVAPASSRGLLVGMHGVMILVGYSSCAWIDVGFYFLDDTRANWRVPLAFQALWPAALGCMIWGLPESPRYLIEHNRLDEARAVMKTLEDGFDDEKFDIIVEQIANENSHSSWSSLFTVPAYRKRLFVGFMAMIGGQATGTLVVTNYTPALLKGLGFSNLNQLLLSAGYITTGLIWNFICALILDIVGRKVLLLIGFIGAGVLCMSMECILVGLYSGTDNKGGNSAAVFFIFLHLFFYGGTVDANTYVYATEIWPTHIRSKGTALSTSGLFVGVLAFTTGVSTALNNIGWKFYLVFVCMSTVNTVIVYFIFPETKGLSLEEIGVLFGEDPVEKVERLEALEMDSEGLASGSSTNREKRSIDVKEARVNSE